MPLNRFLPWRRTRKAPTTAPPASPPPAPDKPLTRSERLDLQSAVIHHLEWCVQFNNLLTLPPGEQRTLPDWMNADLSDLGLWFVRMAPQPLGRHPRFAELIQAQRQLHTLAQQALQLNRAGQTDQACTLLNTAFERERLRVLDLLRTLQQG
ncbi:hypothetical protein [Hydrogenophaga electricum]|uniref:Chemoreceptor zinc-binding domain-containing protein n=1 Tax=Hydrogenophaga electricum TaxID=1230953 RepID=A0ABQ6C653_9BURK|nr:hypothetical protein [Hydrogenophaga electricum]GLS15157.1 hypothetical protein GCM10007935_25900 [Hydrogenophaga electricum]